MAAALQRLPSVHGAHGVRRGWVRCAIGSSFSVRIPQAPAFGLSTFAEPSALGSLPRLCETAAALVLPRLSQSPRPRAPRAGAPRRILIPCRSGGTGRRRGLKILCRLGGVRVQVPAPAPETPALGLPDGDYDSLQRSRRGHSANQLQTQRQSTATRSAFRRVYPSGSCAVSPNVASGLVRASTDSLVQLAALSTMGLGSASAAAWA